MNKQINKYIYVYIRRIGACISTALRKVTVIPFLRPSTFCKLMQLQGCPTTVHPKIRAYWIYASVLERWGELVLRFLGMHYALHQTENLTKMEYQPTLRGSGKCGFTLQIWHF